VALVGRVDTLLTDKDPGSACSRFFHRIGDLGGHRLDVVARRRVQVGMTQNLLNHFLGNAESIQVAAEPSPAAQ
jgi:hypothetical protein